MDLLEIFIIFLMLFKMATSLKCYKCQSIYDLEYVYENSCENFMKVENKEKYEVECKYSTLCYKKETTLEVSNKLMTIINRGCALQLMEGDQVRENHKWKYVKRVYEPYEPKCSESSDDYQRMTKTVNCYCRDELCNSSSSLRRNLMVHSIVIAIFNYILVL